MNLHTLPNPPASGRAFKKLPSRVREGLGEGVAEHHTQNFPSYSPPACGRGRGRVSKNTTLKISQTSSPLPRAGGAGGGCRGTTEGVSGYRTQDFRQHRIHIMYHAIVTEPQDTNPTLTQPRFAPFIIGSRSVCCMSIPIHFDREFLFKAIEIQNERIDQMLPSEFKTHLYTASNRIQVKDTILLVTI
jgi:hypothetical protein